MRFYDRLDAGRRLASALEPYRDDDVVVYALPRGGAPVAAPIAQALHAPLTLALVRKIGVPDQPEVAMGAIADVGAPVLVRNEDVIAAAGVNERIFEQARAREAGELARRRMAYLAGRAPVSPRGRTAIVVDDGVATGATTRAALRALRALDPKRLVLAVPVAPLDTLAALQTEADEIICLYPREDFAAIGVFYEDFSQVSDAEVIALLDAASASTGAARANPPARG
jgi:putative phosphoribosyl transferase